MWITIIRIKIEKSEDYFIDRFIAANNNCHDVVL